MTSTSAPRTLAFRQGGSGDRVAVFVHGMCQSSVFWEPTLRSLPAGLRGYAVDLPGFGDSHAVAGPYTIQGHADAVDEFVQQHGLTDVVLVGNSMGGIVCQQVAVRQPAWLAKLMLVASGPNVPDPAAALAGADIEAKAVWDRAAATEYVTHFFVRQPADPEPYIVAALPATVAARVGTRRSSATTDLRPDLGKIAVPTLIVQGERDAGRTPAVGADMAARIPGARLEIIAGVGHTPMLEDPEAFTPLLHAFLTS